MGSHFTKRKNFIVNEEAKKAQQAAVVAAYKASVNNLLNSEPTKKGFIGKNASDIAFEKAKKEGAANAAKLMAEMKAEEGNFNIKRDILASQAIEKQQNISADKLRQTLSGEGEEFNFTKVGQYQPKPVVEEKPVTVYHDNATYTDTDGVLRDAIGREMNQTWTNVGQESYVGQNTDELAFEAIEAIKNEEKAVVTKDEYSLSHGMEFSRAAELNNSTASVNTQHPAYLANQHREDKRQNDLIDEIANASDKAAAAAQSKAVAAHGLIIFFYGIYFRLFLKRKEKLGYFPEGSVMRIIVKLATVFQS